MSSGIYKRKPFTEEHKQHIGDALRGKHPTKDAKQHMREAHLGKHHTKSTKQKQREAHLGVKSNMYGRTGEKSQAWKGGEEASQRRDAKKYRGLGFIPINDKFDGTEAHHIDRDFVIYIPKRIHKSIYHSIVTGKNMKEMNKAAFEYTYREDRELFDQIIKEQVLE